MKILNRDDFAKLPAGTLYASGDKWFFNDLLVKGDTYESGRDWSERSLLHYIDGDENAIMELGVSVSLNADYGRHGLFDSEYVFYVFEKSDLQELQSIITEALKVSNEPS